MIFFRTKEFSKRPAGALDFSRSTRVLEARGRAAVANAPEFRAPTRSESSQIPLPLGACTLDKRRRRIEPSLASVPLRRHGHNGRVIHFRSRPDAHRVVAVATHRGRGSPFVGGRGTGRE